MPVENSTVYALGPLQRTIEGAVGRVVYCDPDDGATHLWVGDPQPGELVNPTYAPVLGRTLDGWPIVDHP
jgi:hypothetical protein